MGVVGGGAAVENVLDMSVELDSLLLLLSFLITMETSKAPS